VSRAKTTFLEATIIEAKAANAGKTAWCALPLYPHFGTVE
jgi:hypothetical protein